MGCSMHATAQALIRASTLEKDPLASPATLRKALFLRFYGHEFDSARRKQFSGPWKKRDLKWLEPFKPLYVLNFETD